MNVPFTYPFKAVYGYKNCIILSDYFSPKIKLWPESLHIEYTNLLNDTPPSNFVEENFSEVFIKYIMRLLVRRIKLYLNLIEDVNWDFFICIFSVIDWLEHSINFRDIYSLKRDKRDFYDYFREIFKLVDYFVGKIIDESDFVVLVSDHGFSPKRIRINIYNLLEHLGLIKIDTLTKLRLAINYGAQFIKNSHIGAILSIIRDLVDRSSFRINELRLPVIYPEILSYALYIRTSTIKEILSQKNTCK